MTKSDYNKLGLERRGGPIQELVGIRDGVVENAWLKVQEGALAMDFRAVKDIDEAFARITEAAMNASLHAPTMGELPVEQPAGISEAGHYADAANQAGSVATFPMQQMAPNTPTILDEPDRIPDYIDPMPAEAPAVTYDNPETRSGYASAA
jgi:hypothetical protein